MAGRRQCQGAGGGLGASNPGRERKKEIVSTPALLLRGCFPRVTGMESYRVNLDVYNGPLDLLLYLIRREEVDIYDIPIARVTDQYCQYVELIRDLDPNLAGEFLVLAATLMEIKSRMLLPTPPPAETGEPEGLGDPRADLVRQLLQYKAFKDAAEELRRSADQQALRHPRGPARPEFRQDELDLENVQVWNLLEAFNKLMASIGRLGAAHEVVYDDTPIALHAEDILDRLRRDGNLTFGRIFEGRKKRLEIVGLFLALLELIRQNKIWVQQEKDFGEVYVFLKDVADEPARPAASGPSSSEESMIAFNEDSTSWVTTEVSPSNRNLVIAAGTALDELMAPARQGLDAPPAAPMAQEEGDDWTSEDEEFDEEIEDDDFDDDLDDDLDDDFDEDEEDDFDDDDDLEEEVGG
jgi:segregation and condensation protein A